MNTCAVSLCAYYHVFWPKKKPYTFYLFIGISFFWKRFRGYIFFFFYCHLAVENLKSSLAQHLCECIHGTFDALFRQNVNVELKYKISLWLGLNTRLFKIQQELWLNSFKTSDTIWLSDRNFDQKSRPLVKIPVRSEPSDDGSLIWYFS